MSLHVPRFNAGLEHCSRTHIHSLITPCSFTYKTQRALPGALLRSAIVTHATVMVELSPASKQAQGLHAQVEAILASSAGLDMRDADIFKACACISAAL